MPENKEKDNINLKGKFTASEIADFYIQLLNSLPGNDIDNLKLNKLLYYAQGWSLVKLGYPIFSDDIEAWDHGPVIPKVYHTYKICGSNPIEGPIEKFDESKLNNQELELLIDVYNTYGKYTGWSLRERTHRKGSPWQQVYVKGQNKIITLQSMMDYFQNGNDHLETFQLNTDPSNIISSVPSDWDTSEDDVYG